MEDKRYYKYANDVADGRILACNKVKLAVKRFQQDLKKQSKKTFEYRFDEKKADLIIAFVERLKHYQDRWAGTRIKLEPWQCFILANIYGWVRKDDGRRRFKKAYIQVARKNGKTIMLSALALWDVLTTKGGEAYAGATKFAQARRVTDNIYNFVKSDSELRSRLAFKRTEARIVNDMLSSVVAPVAADSNKLDGLFPSLIIIDEAERHRSSELADVLQSGQGAASQPLMFEIGTSSTDFQSYGRIEYEACEKLLEGITQDENFFAIVYEYDEEDDWKDLTKLIKANPNIDVSVMTENIKAFRDEAIRNPIKEIEYRTKICNRWIVSSTSWIKDKTWQKCIKNTKDYDLSNAIAVAAIDLSKRTDFTAYTTYFYLHDKKKFIAKHHFYIPEGQIEEKMKSDSLQIRTWIKQGYITATPGETIDYQYLYNDLEKDLAEYKLLEIAYDEYLSGGLEDKFRNLATMIPVAQGNKLSVPIAEWEKAILDNEIIDNNPVMRWMVSNAEVKVGPTGLIQIVKPESRKRSRRIDGVITSIMAHSRLKVHAENYDPRSLEEIEKDMEKALADIDY